MATYARYSENRTAPKAGWYRPVKRKWAYLKDGTVVYTVNGYEVRSNLDVAWIGSGNPERDPYIPDCEIWIENSLCREDRLAFVEHELVSRNTLAVMRERGNVDYKEANRLATLAEAKFRHEQFKVTAQIIED
jgi:hypothetical protein